MTEIIANGVLLLLLFAALACIFGAWRSHRDANERNPFSDSNNQRTKSK